MLAGKMREKERVFAPSHDRVKDQVKESAFRLIQKNRSMSQKQILDSHKIRPTDLSNAIKELLADRMILKDNTAEEHGRGRPEVFFRANERRLVCFALYVDSWTIRAAIVDMNGTILYQLEQYLGADIRTDELMEVQRSLIDELRVHAPQDAEVLGVGISVPGSVDADALLWHESQRWQNIRDVDYSAFQKQIGMTVRLCRDLDSALASELLTDSSLKDELVVLLHWGIGLGISFAYRGQIVQSNHGRFGTIGFTQFNPYDVDHIGENNMEQYTSLRSLIRTIRYKYPMAKLDEREIAAIAATDSFDDIPDIQIAIDHVGLALRNLCAVLYPDRVLLLSPFAENDTLVQKLQSSFAGGRLIGNLQAKIPLIPVNNGYTGCAIGSTYPLFEKGFERYLRARY